MIDSILARIGLDTSPFAQGLRSAKGMAANFRKAMTSVLGQLGIGLGLGALTHGFQSLLDKADELQTTADQLDVSADFFQRWVNGSASAGVGVDKSTVALRFFMKALGDARRGLQGPAKAFADLGISIENGLSPEQIIGPVADALANMSDQARRASDASHIFGAGSSEFLAALKGGAEGFAELRASAKGVIGQDDLDRLNEAARALKELKQTLTANAGGLAGKIGQLGAEIGLNSVAFDLARRNHPGQKVTRAMIDEELRKLKEGQKEQDDADEKRKQAAKALADQRAAASRSAKEFADQYYKGEEAAQKAQLKREEEITKEKARQHDLTLKAIDSALSALHALDAARADRGHFSLTELANLNPSNPIEAQKIFAARRALDAEQFARGAMLNNRPDLADQAFAYSDRIRGSLGVLTAADRNPFGALEAKAKETADGVMQLVQMSQTTGLKIIPSNGP